MKINNFKKLELGLVTGSILAVAFTATIFFANLNSVNATDHSQSSCGDYCERYLACVKRKTKPGEVKNCNEEVPVPKGCKPKCATPQ